MKSLQIKLIILLGVVGFIGCADLDEPQPLNSIPTQSAITDQASASAAMNGVYSDLQDGTLAFDGYLNFAQLFSDEAVFTGTFPSRLEFGNFEVFPANTTNGAVFSDLYEVINRANNVIALVPNVEDEAFSAESKSDFVAQARFVRGFVYLHLASLWQNVPLVTTPTIDVGDVLNITKSSQADIYAQVQEDLAFAEANLIDATGPVLASQQAAMALQARLALYRGDYTTALSKAQQALGAGFDLTVVPYLADQIYSLSFSATDGNALAFFYGTADLGGRHSLEPSPAIINAFEIGDIRFALSINTTFSSQPFGLKYPSFAAATTTSATDPIFFVRHAEMVLIAAEAAAETGDFTTANRFYNQVRLRAGLEPKILDGANYVDLILQERFVEFAFEGAQRLIDLRRRGKALEVLGPLGYDPCDNIWPLPQREVDRNINLVQNDCCNC